MKVQDGRSEIDVVHPDGTASGGLTALGLNGEPAWSPDGRRLAYVCANFALCVMNADGSGQTALTDTGAWSGAYVFDEYPTWSPDGKRLAFQSNRGNLDYGIWVVNGDGTGLHRLAGNAGGDGDYSPAWSPDGTRIVFESDDDFSYDLFLMSPDGGLIARLTRTDGDEDSPAWSPDGTKIVYTRWRGDFSKVWLMNADGSGQHALTTGKTDEYYPVWSPDGTKILFSSDRGGNIDLYVMNADGSGQPFRLTSGDGVEIFPTWQPIVPNANSASPPAASTTPLPTNDAPLVGETFDRYAELSAVGQAIFEALSRRSIAAQRIAYGRLETSSRRAAATLAAERPTSGKGMRIQRLVVQAFNAVAVEGRERRLALDAGRRGDRKAQRQHTRAANIASERAHSSFRAADDLIG